MSNENIKSLIKLLLFILIALVVFFLNKKYHWSIYISDIDNLIGIKEYVNNNLLFAIFLYSIITIIGCVLLALPGITFAIVAGIIFGPVIGTFVCLFATTIGAMLSFLVGKYLLKDAIKPMLQKNKVLNDLLFSNDNKKDIIILMITRILPIFPYNLQNFAYGITDITFFNYSFFTFIFMLPGVALFTVGASSITAEGDKWMYYLVAIILFIFVIVIGIFVNKKFLINKRETSGNNRSKN